MYHTNAKATLGLYDDGAKAVMTPSVTGPLQPWSNINCLKQDEVMWEKWATTEIDRFRSDNTYRWFPRPADMNNYCWSVWGSELSNDSGELSTPIIITLDFDTPRTSVGFDIHFDVPGDEWMTSVFVEWFDATGFRLSNRTYSPDKAFFFASNFVPRFSKVVFTFTGTSKPRRYAKIMNIDIGHLHVFQDSDILNLTVNEEYDPISQELRVNTMSLKVWDPDYDFSFLNRDSFAAGITDYQQIHLWEYVEGEEVYMGKFYLNTWKCPSQNTATFTGKDIVGTMDGDYHQGGIYVDKPAGELIAEIFNGGYEYYLDPTLSNIKLNGWLPNARVRDNLKQVAFAINANIITARDSKVNIVPDTFRSHTYYSFTRQFISGTSFELDSRVTSIILYSHTYSKGILVEELHKATYSPGEYIINFDDPVHDYTAEGATLLTRHPNWCTIRVTTNTEVTISGIKYVDSITQFEHIPDNLPPIVVTNIERFEKGTLVSLDRVDMILQRLAAYFDKRIIANCLVRLEPNELLADTVTMDTWHGNRFRGVVHKMKIDMANGFRADCELHGELAPADFLYFMPEIHMSNDVVI